MLTGKADSHISGWKRAEEAMTTDRDDIASLLERVAALDDASPNEEIGGFVGDGSWRSLGTVAEIRRLAAALDSPPDHGGGEGADRCHPSHVTRISMDASSYDEICVISVERPTISAGGGKLAKPCPCASLPTQESEDGR